MACGLPHPIANCFYVFPEKAPQWFHENPEIRLVVDGLLKSDTALKEEVRRLKTKKSKSETPNRSKDSRIVEEDG